MVSARAKLRDFLAGALGDELFYICVAEIERGLQSGGGFGELAFVPGPGERSGD
jgi:hypothetical protein